MNKIYITDEESKIIESIFSDFKGEVIVFGSRVTGKHSSFSDLDICLKGVEEISLSDLFALKRACSNSDLPFKVDLVDYHDISDSFKKVIDRDGIIIAYN